MKASDFLSLYFSSLSQQGRSANQFYLIPQIGFSLEYLPSNKSSVFVNWPKGRALGQLGQLLHVSYKSEVDDKDLSRIQEFGGIW